MTAPKPFNIAIIGGGISGLTLAIALSQHSIPITIYEAADRFGEIGAGVAFGPNAAKAMQLIHPRINEAFEKCKTDNLWESKSKTWFTVRVGDARRANDDGFVKPGKKVGNALFDIRYGEKARSGGVYRAHFLDELVKDVPKEVARFGKKLVDIKDARDGSGDKVLHFQDGTTAQHNAVIGCDGIKSATRKFVLGENDPAAQAVFSGKYAYRGLIPMDEAVDLLGEEEAKNSNMYYGYHGHVLTFPIQKGKTFNVVAFRSRETWDNENWVVRTSKEDLKADFEGWGPTVQSIIDAIRKPDIWALFNDPPASIYYKGRVCLLGDAAHATTPHQGAGAGMCLEDALILSNLLEIVDDAEDLECAFTVYDEIRRPRTQKLVETSREAGTIYEFELEGDDLDKIEKNVTSRMSWIWDHDLEAELDLAKKKYLDSKARSTL